MFERIGAPELVIVLVIVLLIFGAGKLPQVGGSIGKAMREFRNGLSGADGPKKEPEEAATTTKHSST